MHLLLVRNDPRHRPHGSRGKVMCEEPTETVVKHEHPRRGLWSLSRSKCERPYSLVHVSCPSAWWHLTGSKNWYKRGGNIAYPLTTQLWHLLIAWFSSTPSAHSAVQEWCPVHFPLLPPGVKINECHYHIHQDVESTYQPKSQMVQLLTESHIRKCSNKWNLWSRCAVKKTIDHKASR